LWSAPGSPGVATMFFLESMHASLSVSPVGPVMRIAVTGPVYRHASFTLEDVLVWGVDLPIPYLSCPSCLRAGVHLRYDASVRGGQIDGRPAWQPTAMGHLHQRQHDVAAPPTC